MPAWKKDVDEKIGPSKIGATGYCFGGRYVFRLLGDGKVDVGVSAHPSSTTIEEITAAAVAGRPIQLALAGMFTQCQFFRIPLHWQSAGSG